MDKSFNLVHVVVACFVGLVAVVIQLGCGRSEGGGSSQKPLAVCTVGMVTDVVREVAGERLEVVGLLGPETDPHSYRPDRDDIVRLQKANLIFYCGLHLEGKMTETLTKLGEQKPVHAVAERVDSSKLLSPDDLEGVHDPHVWMDASLWAEVVQRVGEDLAAYDPPGAAYYRERAAAYADRCRALHAYGQSVLATVPAEKRVLVTSHDAFKYFGRAYNIEVRGVQGISTESEANVRDINALVDMLVSRKVEAVFVESSVPEKNVHAVIEGARARGHSVRIGGKLFSDAMGPAGTYEGTYLGMIDHNLTTVARALGGQAPAGGWEGKLTQ